MAGPGTILQGLYKPEGSKVTLPTGETIALHGAADWNAYVSDNKGAVHHASELRRLVEREGYKPSSQFDEYYRREYEINREEKRARANRNVILGASILIAPSLSLKQAAGTVAAVTKDSEPILNDVSLIPDDYEFSFNESSRAVYDPDLLTIRVEKTDEPQPKSDNTWLWVIGLLVGFLFIFRLQY